MADDRYRIIRDAVVEALLRPGNGILDPSPRQFAQLSERVRLILFEREGRAPPGGPQYGERMQASDVELVRDVFWTCSGWGPSRSA